MNHFIAKSSAINITAIIRLSGLMKPPSRYISHVNRLRKCDIKDYGLSFFQRSQVMACQYRFKSEIVKVPTMADSITEGELARHEKQPGQLIKRDELLATIETDKVDVSINSPHTAVIVEWLVPEGESVQVGQDLVKLDLDAQPSMEETKPEKVPESTPVLEEEKPQEKVEIPEQKVETPQQKVEIPQQKPSASPAAEFPNINVMSTNREEHRVKMNRMRQRISERLKESQNTAASLTTFNEVDMSNAMQLRKQLGEEFAERHGGLKLGYMGIFARACSKALKDVPAVNASIEEEDGSTPQIVFRDYCDISVAVATPKGLVTPVIRDVDKMSISQFEQSVAAFGKKARDGEISIEDMTGGTFTISNGGVFGSLFGTPIINSPQSAILGMHAIKHRPVAIKDAVTGSWSSEVRPMMYLALTYDHRLIDGREAVTFLKLVKEAVEDPRRLLID